MKSTIVQADLIKLYETLTLLWLSTDKLADSQFN